MRYTTPTELVTWSEVSRGGGFADGPDRNIVAGRFSLDDVSAATNSNVFVDALTNVRFLRPAGLV